MTYTYPGVYVQELPSGVHTITGVATSIAAFAGWAAEGPTDKAALVLSWSDFERQFGGLDVNSYLGYAVNQFFANGGQQAYIVRLTKGAIAGSVTIGGTLTITAANPGAWAHDYQIDIKLRDGFTDRFQLTVSTGTPLAPVETFQNLSMVKTDPRFIESMINGNSAYITAAVIGSPTVPPAIVPPLLLDATVAGDDGTVLNPNTSDFTNALNVTGTATGIHLLDYVDLFNLVCVPGETDSIVLATLETYCRGKRAMLIADAIDQDYTLAAGQLSGITGDDAINAALYYPWINAPNALKQNAIEAFPPCGFVAGLYAKTDANRGVWKAPAGTEASLTGIAGVTQILTDDENGTLNPIAINCIRTFPVYGTVIWGARTLQGNDEVGSDWKYVPVRRMALFIEETLYRASKWVVFEPNDEPLWAQIRLNIGVFMHTLFRQGAFQGMTPKDAYFVKCDSETTTQADINNGIVNIIVGFAPLKPAEFVVIQIQQMAGQLDT